MDGGIGFIGGFGRGGETFPLSSFVVQVLVHLSFASISLGRCIGIWFLLFGKAIIHILKQLSE